MVKISEKNIASEQEDYDRENEDSTSLLFTDNTSDTHVNYLLHNPVNQQEQVESDREFKN